jgi:1-acyl-sn-glycerol-3-phosphate acyltransferase
MNIFQKIFGFICGSWGLILFAVTSLIVRVPLVHKSRSPNRNVRYTFIHISRWWMGLTFPYRLPASIKGRENFKAGENYVVVCNQFVNGCACFLPGIPGGNKTIAKADGKNARLWNHLPTWIRAGDRRVIPVARESFLKMRASAGPGIAMCIYPEGTRTKRMSR